MNGEPALKPGLLAAAHGGILYIDEVNLLPDHLADAMLDAVASGVHVVEREGISARQDADFVLIGSMNPEEGTLRPQLLDRFALVVDVTAPLDPAERRVAVERRLAFDRDPAAFAEAWRAHQEALARDLRARESALAIVAVHARAARSRSASRSAPTASARSARTSRSSEPAARSRRSKASTPLLPITSRACFRWPCVTASRTRRACRKRRRTFASAANAGAGADATAVTRRRWRRNADAERNGDRMPAAMRREGHGRRTAPCPSQVTRCSRRFRSPCRASSRPAAPMRPVPRRADAARRPRAAAAAAAPRAGRPSARVRRRSRASWMCGRRVVHAIGHDADRRVRGATICTRSCGSRPAADAICS